MRMGMKKLALKIHKIMIWSLFIGMILGIFLSAQAAYGWWNASWSYRKKLTFDNSSQTENLTYFPVLIKLTTSRINYSDVGNADGTDLRFIDSNDSTELKYHIEKWNSTGDSFIWVKVPQIDGSSNTDFIYMYYGNAGASDVQDSTSTFSNNYKGVWHMAEASWNGTAGEVKDSTLNGNDGTRVGDATTTTTGQVNGGGTFDGNGDYVEVADSASLDVTNLTINAWVNSTDFTPSDCLRSYNRIAVSKTDGKVGYQLGLTDENKPYFGFGDILVNTQNKYNNSEPGRSDTTSTDGRIPMGSTVGRGDYAGAYAPCVIKDGSTYKMWYIGREDNTNANYRIYYATSPDGLTWTKYDNTVPSNSDTSSTNGRIPLGTNGKGDDYYAYRLTVIKDGSAYKMWYTGYDGSNWRIYCATSSDNLTWTKYDNSIAGSTQDSGQTSTNGRLYFGSNGTGDDAHIYAPTVIKDGSTYKMWYSGHNGSNWRIYYATSTDGLTWTKYNNSIAGSTQNTDQTSTNGRLYLGSNGTGDDVHVYESTVIKDGSTYIMWYSGHDGSRTRIYCATSPDGLTWTKVDNSVPSASNTSSTNGRIALGLSESGDDYSVGFPAAIKDGSKYKVWYYGDNGSDCRYVYYTTLETGITSDSAVPSEFRMLSGVADITADTIKLYVNGGLDTSGTTTVNEVNNSEELTIGNLLNGKIDEVRISSTTSTADWIAAQYGSMNDTFISDFGPPAAITDLTGLCDSDTGDVTLSWSTPGDDDWTGTLPSGSKYIIDYSTYSIQWSTTNYKVSISTSGVAPHTEVSHTITGLTGDSTYYFRIWTRDEVPTNWSGLSNGATVWVNSVLSVTIEPSSRPFGEVDAGQSDVLTDGFTVENTGNVTQKYQLRLTGVPTAWAAKNVTGAPEWEQAKILGLFTTQSPLSTTHFNDNPPDTGDGDIVRSTNDDQATGTNFAISEEGAEVKGYNVTVGGIRYLWFRFDAPSGTSITTEQFLTVTVTAIQQ